MTKLQTTLSITKVSNLLAKKKNKPSITAKLSPERSIGDHCLPLYDSKHSLKDYA